MDERGVGRRARLRLCESVVRITEGVGRAMGLPVPSARLGRLEAALEPTLAEWSLSAAGTARAGARVVLGGDDLDAAARALELEGASRLAALHRKLKVGGQAGLGVSLGAPGTARRATAADALRYYRVAPPGQGYELYLCAREALPSKADDAVALARICGAERCAALSAVSTGDSVQELTLFFSVADPRTLIAVLERAMLPTSARANLFFKGILGLSPDGARPWPRLWVGRARSGGWKFYYLARGDAHRRTDAVLLDATDAGGVAWTIRDTLTSAAEIPATPTPLVQALGLKFSMDLSAPDWTLYLSPLERP